MMDRIEFPEESLSVETRARPEKPRKLLLSRKIKSDKFFMQKMEQGLMGDVDQTLALQARIRWRDRYVSYRFGWTQKR
jgi:hypothetical protein